MQYLTDGHRLFEVALDTEVANFGRTRDTQPTLRVVVVRDLQVPDDIDRVPNSYCEACRTVYGAEYFRLGDEHLAHCREVVAA